MVSMLGVVDGFCAPRWQVQQVTCLAPLKFSALILFTISTIRRATTFRGGSAAQSGWSVPAPVWQSPQHTLRAAENSPMVPMNSSTGMPFSTWIFLNACSDIWGRAPPCACANATRPNGSVLLSQIFWPERSDEGFDEE